MSNLKDKAECGGDQTKCKADGCPLFGTLLKNGKVKGCKDPAAIGGRNRRYGLKKQRAARKALGIPPTKAASTSSNEENWKHEHFRFEVKAGQQVQALTTRFLTAEAQSDASRSIGDPRGFAFVAMPADMSDGIVAIRLSQWQKVVQPALNDYYGGQQ